MKKLILLFFFSIFFLNSQGQTSVYHPFPDSDAEWRDLSYGWGDGTFEEGLVEDFHYWIEGDTIINSLIYHKILKEYAPSMEYSSFNWTYPCAYKSAPPVYSFKGYIGGIREDSIRKIYFFPDTSNQESLLYDFGNLSLGAQVPLSYTNVVSGLIVYEIDSVLVGPNYRTRYLITDSAHVTPYNTYLIEGIGSMNGLFLPMVYRTPIGFYRNQLLCFKENGITEFETYYQCYANHNCSMSLSIKDIDSKKIVLTPNPASDKITISNYPFSDKEASIEIYNMMGEKLQTINFKPETAVDVSNLGAGVYLVEVRDGEKTYRSKIIKQ